jgi:hypothetical protein
MNVVTKNDYQDWLNDDVTKAFLAEISERLNDECQRLITGTPDDIMRVVHARNEAITIFRDILEWKPESLINQEE